MPRFNIRHEQFATEYIACGGNASEAYRRVYPRSTAWKPASVETKGSRLLAKVWPRVEALRQAAAARQEGEAIASRVDLLKALSRSALACPTDLLRPDGSLDLDRARQCRQEVSAITVEDLPTGGRRHKIQFRDGIAAAERIAKLQGWDKPAQVEVSATVGTVDRESLRAMFETMTPAEREAWLASNLKVRPPAWSCSPTKTAPP